MWHFKIKDGVLLKYTGWGRKVAIPTSVTSIGKEAFKGCRRITSITIPPGVTSIGDGAFEFCSHLMDITIPPGVTSIGDCAFEGCSHLMDITIPPSVTSIGEFAFAFCESLASITIPPGVTSIGEQTFESCKSLANITIPDSVTSIGGWAFAYCKSLTSITIPGKLTNIGERAFAECNSFTSIKIPENVTSIGARAFENCKSLTDITIPSSVTNIGEQAFYGCESLTGINIGNSVTDIGYGAFLNCPQLTVICPENSAAHRYCEEQHISYLLDYQYAAFQGTVPRGLQRLASPFHADEEKPYLFISYSHRDRERVFPILKTLYEAGWRIWYDEGLNIGESYDRVLEAHVENCAAFLLFVTGNSRISRYIGEHEIPWAKQYGKPILRCALDAGTEYGIENAKIIGTVSPEEIEPALERIDGLTKGGKREAKGIMVSVDPAARGDHAEGDGFAYALYAEETEAGAKTVLHEIKNGGATVYDATEEGENQEKLRESACLIVFLDKAFLAEEPLVKTLVDACAGGKDIVVCRLEKTEDVTLPAELEGLGKSHWLNYSENNSGDMSKKLMEYLAQRGCRDASVIPGFEYEKTAEGIAITRYTAQDPCPRLEKEYGGVPVVSIADHAFQNCIFITEFAIPDSVTSIGKSAFDGCSSLASITIPENVTSIGARTFDDCKSLTSITIPDNVTSIGEWAFKGCECLTSITIPDRVTSIGDGAFACCESLASITIPDNVTSIGGWAFACCESLTSITIPENVTSIGARAFKGCKSLANIKFPGKLTSIGEEAFFGCGSLTSITIPPSVTSIADNAFVLCLNLTNIKFGGTKKK